MGNQSVMSTKIEINIIRIMWRILSVICSSTSISIFTFNSLPMSQGENVCIQILDVYRIIEINIC